MTGGHSRAWQILHRRCPACGEGRVFRAPFAMNERCPICGLKFERGPGYFTGAMYFSYALALPTLSLGVLVGWLLTRWPLHWLLLIAGLAHLPLVPTIWQYSRVMFLHMDRYFDPDG